MAGAAGGALEATVVVSFVPSATATMRDGTTTSGDACGGASETRGSEAASLIALPAVVGREIAASGVTGGAMPSIVAPNRALATFSASA
jgi:hypothetical protein